MNDRVKAKLLIVDDEPFYIDTLVAQLGDEFNLSIAKNGKQAIERASVAPLPDLILLDVMMPDIDGYEVCRTLKENPLTCEIPVIFLTVKSEVEDEMMGFALGAEDYITKPMSPPIVKARVRNHLTLANATKRLEQQNLLLESMVSKRTNELFKTREGAVFAIASLAEKRDRDTGFHVDRTQRYVEILARALFSHGYYCEQLNDEDILLMAQSAPLHDIGKVGIPDKILLKPGPLDEDEWLIMKTHVMIGVEALNSAEERVGSTPFLNVACEIAQSHHEKWDGSGYPHGLKGEEIPLSGRLMAVADVFDALVNKRVYKDPIGIDEALAIIRKESGKHFDPKIIQVLDSIESSFVALAKQL